MTHYADHEVSHPKTFCLLCGCSGWFSSLLQRPGRDARRASGSNGKAAGEKLEGSNGPVALVRRLLYRSLSSTCNSFALRQCWQILLPVPKEVPLLLPEPACKPMVSMGYYEGATA